MFLDETSTAQEVTFILLLRNTSSCIFIIIYPFSYFFLSIIVNMPHAWIKHYAILEKNRFTFDNSLPVYREHT